MRENGIVFEERLRIPADVFSFDRFREWAHSPGFPESGRLSFISGEIDVDLSPEELESHNKVKGSLFIGISTWAEARNLGETLSDRAFLVHQGASLATEPDVTYVAWESLRSGRVRYAEREKGSRRFVEVVGSPDLVVEVVSEHSVRKDTELLRERYFEAGITEYWLVDARGEEVRFIILEQGEREYVERPADPDGHRRSEVLGGSFRLTRGQNPVGGYAYRLLSRD